MISEKEAQTMLVDVCKTVIVNLSKQSGIPIGNLHIRIDMEKLSAKPVFGVFNKSAFIRRIELSELINLAGGKGLGFIVGIHVRNVIKDIFTELCKKLEETDTKRVFLLLFGRELDQSLVPYFAFYKEGQKVDSITVADLMGGNINTP